MKWECPTCSCKSDVTQDICPNGCEQLSQIDIREPKCQKEEDSINGQVSFHKNEAQRWRALWEDQRGGETFNALQKNYAHTVAENVRLRNVVREFHESVQEFCEVFQDDYDYCQLSLTKEFTRMKKAFWKVKENVLEAS